MTRAAFFSLACLLPVYAAAQTQPTFNRDIAPLLWSRCGSCHREGQSAPFSLQTYDEVRPRAREILRAVDTRRMPPWKPEPGYGEFEDSRRLSDTEIALIDRWASQDFPRGNAEDLPETPDRGEAWQLGEPDLVVRMPEPYTLKGSGADVFRTFVVHVPLATTRYVRAIEFRPGAGGVVHHANIKIDRTAGSRRLDEDENGPGYEGGGSRQSEFPDGHFLGWTPGQSARVSPAGMSWTLYPASDLVLEAHLVPSGRSEPVQLSVGLYFTDEPPERVPYTLRLGRQDIDIAANSQAVFNDSFTLPVDVDVLAVQPHAHHLAREVRAYATAPDGTTTPLILIKDWEFHWQDSYRFSRPIALRAGTTLSMRFTYDNSNANRRNPNNPPRRVTYGQTTTSEMASLWVQVVTRSQQDREILDAGFGPKLLADDIAGYETMLSVNADDPRLHAAMAQAYMEAGKIPAALWHFEEAVKREPTAYRNYDLGAALLSQRRWLEAGARFTEAAKLKADFFEAHFGLGVAFQQQGRIVEAVGAYRTALGLNPRFPDAYYNLGRALAALGQFDEAILEYGHALELEPDDAEVHSSLASALASSAREPEAVVHYRRALTLSPDALGPLVDLSWILSTSARAELRNATEAVTLAERAAVLTRNQDATVLDTLALAYASSGDFSKAIEVAESALRLAQAAGSATQAEQIGRRLEAYKRGK